MVAVLEVANNNYFASFLPVSFIFDAFPYRANTYYPINELEFTLMKRQDFLNHICV